MEEAISSRSRTAGLVCEGSWNLHLAGAVPPSGFSRSAEFLSRDAYQNGAPECREVASPAAAGDLWTVQ